MIFNWFPQKYNKREPVFNKVRTCASAKEEMGKEV